VTVIDDITREPHRFDLFSVLRMLERDAPERPRIGDNAVLADELVRLMQDPYFAFPASNLAGFSDGEGRSNVTVRFLGQFGPQGALPLAITEETYGWLLRRDDAFPRFVDIISNRFLQLFFRAWADSRPIAQHDRPATDRFGAYIGTHIGLGSAQVADLGAVSDSRKLAFAGLLGAKAKSASRLTSFLQGLFGLRVDVQEFVGCQLELDPADCTRLGRASTELGRNTILGTTVFSVQDKIRIRLYARDLAQYLDLLPTGRLNDELLDAVDFYLGDEIDWDVELALPIKDVVPTRLGAAEPESTDPMPPGGKARARPAIGMLGWTSWLSPSWAATEDYRCDARFHPAAAARRNRTQHTRDKG
jgi:type VI secretion system protein ImpH